MYGGRQEIRRKVRRSQLLAAAGVLALVMAACSSQADSGEGGSIDVKFTKDEAAIPAGTGVPESVPTLNELYDGTESAPPASGPAGAKDKFVVYVSCGQLSQGCAGPGKGAAEAAKVLGWKFAVTDAKFNVAGGFATAIRQAVSLKPDGIVLYGFDCGLARQALEEARADKIAIAGLLVRDCGSGSKSLFNANPVYTTTAKSTDEWHGSYGAQQAAFVINKTGGKAKVILLHETDSYPAQVPASVAMLKKCSGCSVVDTINVTGADYAPNSPMVNAIRTAIKRHPDANALMLNFDTALVGTGLAQALKNDPLAKKLTIVAGGGTPDGMRLLTETNSPYTGGIFWDMSWQGWAAMDALNRQFQDAEQVPQGTGTRLVTADRNATTEPGTYRSPIDFKAAYRKVWLGEAD